MHFKGASRFLCSGLETKQETLNFEYISTEFHPYFGFSLAKIHKKISKKF